jgi:hypothetical protein
MPCDRPCGERLLSSKMWEFQIPYFVNGDSAALHMTGEVTAGLMRLGTVMTTTRLPAIWLRCWSTGSSRGHPHRASAGCGEIVRYLARHGAGRIDRIVLTGSTTPFPMKTGDNPLGVDRAWMEADMAVRTSDRAKWYVDNAGGFFGNGWSGCPRPMRRTGSGSSRHKPSSTTRIPRLTGPARLVWRAFPYRMRSAFGEAPERRPWTIKREVAGPFLPGFLISFAGHLLHPNRLSAAGYPDRRTMPFSL